MTTDTPTAPIEEATMVTPVGLPPVKIAFVIDGELVDILHTDERLAAIFLSEPVMVDVSDTYDVDAPFPIGSRYNSETGTFTPPDSDVAPE